MKMTNKTNITSTKGVTLISLKGRFLSSVGFIAPPPPLARNGASTQARDASGIGSPRPTPLAVLVVPSRMLHPNTFMERISTVC
jgi:hypothetical protein